jgi:hypothetical protein
VLKLRMDERSGLPAMRHALVKRVNRHLLNLTGWITPAVMSAAAIVVIPPCESEKPSVQYLFL